MSSPRKYRGGGMFAAPPAPKPPDSLREKPQLQGSVEKIIFRNEENFFTIAQFHPEGEPRPFVITGRMMGVQPGMTLTIEGQWKEDPKHGWKFEVRAFTPALPQDEQAIFKFLSSGLIAGIGEEFARRIVKKFGADTLRVIDETPDEIARVQGIGAKKLAQIKTSWAERRGMRELMLFAGEHGISRSVAERLFKQYGGVEAVNVLKKNPFQLAIDVWGIGFRSADRIAEKMGIARDAPERAEAGVLHTLKDRADDGHLFLPVEKLLEDAAELLQVDAQVVGEAVRRLHEREAIVPEKLPDGQNAVFLKAMHTSERGVAEALKRLLRSKQPSGGAEMGAQRLEDFQRRFQFALTDEQKGAILLALGGGVVVITGGPGTGKTTLVRAMLYAMSSFGRQVLLAAPTGRAAKRMEEACEYPAQTIHRLLKYQPRQGGFAFNERDPLPADVLIVDETSMVDIPLAYHLLKALQPGTTVVFVGDIDQLPSVGPGNFLRDMIASDAVPKVRLMKIFRQAQRSMIVQSAHRINQGKMPLLEAKDGDAADDRVQDFFFVERDDPAEALEAIKALVAERIPKKFRLDPVRDVQVLTPMHNGELGSRNLNHALQELLNSGRDQTRDMKSDQMSLVADKGGAKDHHGPLRPGDKVMQVRNDYDKDVFNGDVGVVETSDADTRLLTVKFDGRIVQYDFSDADQLQLAYAATVHKSQGSEYPAVVIPVHTQHYIMLQRNLIYTAVTRGRQLVCLVGSKKALAIAINNAQIQARNSALAMWLREAKQK